MKNKSLIGSGETNKSNGKLPDKRLTLNREQAQSILKLLIKIRDYSDAK